MFIKSQDGNICSKIESVKIYQEYDEDTEKELQKIYDRISAKAYNYGSTDNYLKAIEKEKEKFIKNNNVKMITKIKVNGIIFGVYKSEDTGKRIYDCIIDALKCENVFFNMSEFSDSEEKK